MANIFNASSRIEYPLIKVEMGIPNIEGFQSTILQRRELRGMSRKDAEELQGDLVEIGEPNLAQADLKAVLRDAGLPVPPGLKTRLEAFDFGLVEVTCSFLPGKDRRFISARIEVSLNLSSTSKDLHFHDLYPRKYETRRRPPVVWVGADFRFYEAPSRDENRLVEIDGMSLEPSMFAIGSGTPLAVWDIDASQAREGLRGVRSLYFIIQKPTRLTSLAWRFRLFAELKTKWGILPVSARRKLQGQDECIMEWPKSEKSGDQMTILFLAAEPVDQRRLRFGAELREIRERLRLPGNDHRFSLQERFSVRWEDVSQALLDVRPRIVHFFGHGNAAGELCFEGPSGITRPVPPGALADLFKQSADCVKCVILVACYASTQASAIAQHIDYVIGLQGEIKSDAARAFTSGFYQQLESGGSIEDAYECGCALLKGYGVPDQQKPRIYKGGTLLT